MLLHDIDSPKVMHDNSLTKDVLNYTDEDKFDVVLMNPPYGGSDKNDIKQHFPSDLSSSETADLFMVLIMYRLAEKGRAAVILPDGFLFAQTMQSWLSNRKCYVNSTFTPSSDCLAASSHHIQA